jgi:hypothetical protein
MVSSEPAGGDIYVDGNFMGNSVLQKHTDKEFIMN